MQSGEKGREHHRRRPLLTECIQGQAAGGLPRPAACLRGQDAAKCVTVAHVQTCRERPSQRQKAANIQHVLFRGSCAVAATPPPPPPAQNSSVQQRHAVCSSASACKCQQQSHFTHCLICGDFLRSLISKTFAFSNAWKAETTNKSY